MLFNSWVFIGFLLTVLTLYYVVPVLRLHQRFQIALLFLSSLLFYAYETPSLVLLLLFSLAINSGVSRAIVFASARQGTGIVWLWMGVAANLSILVFFKYASLVAELILPAGTALWLREDLASIPLPVGISFYTFQAISLIVDLHKKGVTGVRNLEELFAEGRSRDGFLNIAFYIAFFPQLVAGPIVKAHDFIGQIGLKRWRSIDWNIVTHNLITGYFLKMVIADNLKDVTYLLNSTDLHDMGRLDLIALLYGYSFQIFADFAGYSLIAIGLGALFGYRFPINFNFPYISSSITEFWRRWHISLSSFLKEYLYFPLGGNRKGAVRTYINLFVVMFLGGLWHGAAWSYAIWGMSHGLLLAAEKMYKDVSAGQVRPEPSRVAHVVRIVLVFHVVSVLWLLFLMPDFARVVEYFTVILTTDRTLTTVQNIYVVAVYALPVVAYHVFAYLRENPLVPVAAPLFALRGQALILSAMLFLITVNSGTTGEFIYFQF